MTPPMVILLIAVCAALAFTVREVVQFRRWMRNVRRIQQGYAAAYARRSHERSQVNYLGHIR